MGGGLVGISSVWMECSRREGEEEEEWEVVFHLFIYLTFRWRVVVTCVVRVCVGVDITPSIFNLLTVVGSPKKIVRKPFFARRLAPRPAVFFCFLFFLFFFFAQRSSVNQRRPHLQAFSPTTASVQKATKTMKNGFGPRVASQSKQ